MLSPRRLRHAAATATNSLITRTRARTRSLLLCSADPDRAQDHNHPCSRRLRRPRLSSSPSRLADRFPNLAAAPANGTDLPPSIPGQPRPARPPSFTGLLYRDHQLRTMPKGLPRCSRHNNPRSTNPSPGRTGAGDAHRFRGPRVAARRHHQHHEHCGGPISTWATEPGQITHASTKLLPAGRRGSTGSLTHSPEGPGDTPKKRVTSGSRFAIMDGAGLHRRTGCPSVSCGRPKDVREEAPGPAPGTPLS